jgi:cytochrome c
MSDRSNTILGWALFGGIAALGLGIVSGEYFHPEKPETGGFPIEGVEEGGEGGGAAAEAPIANVLATADAAAGEGVFKKCMACHTITPGGANGIGPNLHGVMGKPQAAHAGFAYSDALKAVGKTWTFEEMDHWLKSPKSYANGTKMSFAGLGKIEDRAALMLYLNSQGSNLPLPAPVAETAAPAEGDAAADANAAAPTAADANAAAPADANAAAPAAK